MKIRDSPDYYEVEKKVKEKIVRGKNPWKGNTYEN